MEQKNIIASIIVLALIIVGMFVFAYLKKNEIGTPVTTPTAVIVDDNSSYPNITRIDAKHFFQDGTHTIVGEVLMPTPCDLLNWNTRIQESFPETAIIDFEVVNHSENCIQAVTPQRFKESFSASREATIRATFQGRAVELNLIPALEGESPEDFELFIKG